MSDETFLVTGALGCIGAWVVRELVLEGIPVAAFDLGKDPQRLRLILSDEELARVRLMNGDITNETEVEAAVAESGATRIIHLAALQVPFCKATPILGARVNVVGTVNLFEAAKKRGIRHLAYASSIAVYGMSEEYPEGRVDDESALHPRNLYGVYKQANEGTARIYWQDDKVASIGLRPYVVYGPGRDQGLTSGPTKAMLAAARGENFHIPFGGRCVYQYVRDVARLFIQAARVPFEGAEVFNLRGSVASMEEIVAAIETSEPGTSGKITFTPEQLALPSDVDDSRLRAVLGRVPETALREGVGETIAIFKRAIQQGRV